MSTELVAGAVVGGRYRLDRLLGEGGMGVVWAASDVEGGEPVAIKLLRAEVAGDEATRRRFLREARAAAAVQHPNVVTIRDVLELPDGVPALVMDLLEGESLRDKLDRERRIPLPELARILLPVVSAVGSAHARGIVHRDLKPDNVFLLAGADDGAETARVKVLDFGIAKLTAVEGAAARTAALTATGALLGTPYYMSPEQILGEPDVDQRADIWSLGVILYECLTGIRPTEADSVGKVLRRILNGTMAPIRLNAPDLPADVTALVDRMLTADRKRRLGDLHEVAEILKPYGDIRFRSFGPPAPMPPDPDTVVDRRLASTLADPAQIVRAKGMLSTLPTGAAPSPPSSATPATMSTQEPRVVEPAPSSPAAALPGPPRSLRWRAAALGAAVIVAGAAIALLRGRPGAAVPGAPASAVGAPCPDGMALVRGGVFRMGSESGKEDERPVHEVTVATFCLDLTEVTVGAYKACFQQRRCRPPETTVKWAGIEEGTREIESRFCHAYQADRDAHPINCVSWEEADHHCRAADKRLPTEPEWEYVARAGAEGRPYPWGAASPAPGLLNACDTSCASHQAELGRRYEAMFPESDGFQTTAPVGRFPAGDAAFGVHDLAGNVGEWTASPYCTYPDHGCASPSRVFRGGGWLSQYHAGPSTTQRLWSAPEHRYADVGFRCARDVAAAR